MHRNRVILLPLSDFYSDGRCAGRSDPGSGGGLPAWWTAEAAVALRRGGMKEVVV